MNLNRSLQCSAIRLYPTAKKPEVILTYQHFKFTRYQKKKTSWVFFLFFFRLKIHKGPSILLRHPIIPCPAQRNHHFVLLGDTALLDMKQFQVYFSTR